jgi:hypothetical protein
VRRRVLATGALVVLTGCGNAAQTARNPESAGSTPPQMQRAVIGQPIVLSGVDDASGTGELKLSVSVKKVVPTAVGKGAFEKPRKGERFAAVRFVFKNVGETAYHDSPTFGAKLIDTTGKGYDPTVATVSAGAAFPRVLNLPHGRSKSGYIVFAVPKKARISCVQYALNAGAADELGEWRPR